MKPKKDEYTNDDVMADMGTMLNSAEQYRLLHQEWNRIPLPDDCYPTVDAAEEAYHRIVAYIENTEAERDRYFEAMNAALRRCTALKKERDFFKTNLAACHSNFTAADERHEEVVGDFAKAMTVVIENLNTKSDRLRTAAFEQVKAICAHFIEDGQCDADACCAADCPTLILSLAALDAL